jgi:hypothetical protein
VRPRTLVALTTQAKHKLRPGEVLVFDWHRLAICGAVSLRRTTDAEIRRSGAFVPLGDEATPVCAHRRAYSGEFGLRAILGRPTTDHVSGGAT